MAPGHLLRTVGAVAALGLAVHGSKLVLAGWLQGAGRIQAAAALVLVIAVGGLVYALALLLLGAVRHDDLELLGGPGRRLQQLFTRLGLLRP